MGKKHRHPTNQAKASVAKGPGHRSLWPWALIAVLMVGAVLWRAQRRPHASNESGSVADAISVPSSLPQQGGIQSETPAGGAVVRDVAGAEACAECHREEYDRWKGSTHGQAGGVPGQVEVIAVFDGKPLRFKDATVIPMINPRGEYVFRLQPDGEEPLEIKVDATVGGGHMVGGGTQTFFKRMADGTVRFLPFDFIRKENLWFVQLRRDQTWVPVSSEIALATDLANWPPHRVLGTKIEFSNCQNCHGSQITLHYDEAARAYATHYESLSINCESCHGPGRRHIDLVRQPGWEERADIGMEPLAGLTKDQSLQVCFQCHATKDALRDDPYLPGKDLEDYFSLKLPLFSEDPFLVDGRVRRFGYQLNHLYSDCYLSGSMTCVDCHDPHGQDYRDVFGKRLEGRFDNGQCTGCHASKALAPELHSHHKTDSEGSLCTSCHMPYLQHQGVGPHLKFARSDHTIPIPRPSFDQEIGIENACQKCHADQDLAWQEEHFNAWYGDIKPHPALVARLVRSERVRDLAAAARLMLDPEGKHPMAQTAGLAGFIKRYLHPRMETVAPDVLQKLKAFASSQDLDLQALALMALQVACDRDPAAQTVVATALEGEDEDAASGRLRSRWGVAADHWGEQLAQQGRMEEALFCFEKSLEVMPNSIVTLSHLAKVELALGNPSKALETLRLAVRVQPYNAVLHFQMAQIHAGLQETAEAIAALEKGLSYAPEDQAAQSMLRYLKGQ